MTKSNVNPNHYKVAGRERQGEDIPQARNKQKHAESLVRRRAERNGASQKTAVDRSAAPASPALPDGPGRAAKTATRKTRATPRRTPPGHSRGHTLVPGSPAPHARFAKTRPAPVLRPMGADPALRAKKATKKATKKANAATRKA